MRGKIVITGGGTGGHLYPMLAIAEALVARGVAHHDIVLVGSARGQDGIILADSRFERRLLPGRGLRRSLSLEATRANLGALAGLGAALLHSLWWTLRERPRVVVSVGGYAAAASSFAAWVARRPLVLVDLDAAPSLTNRLLQRVATQRCRAFPGPGGGVVTGAPLRHSLRDLDRRPATRRERCREVVPPLDPERVTVVVMSGSLGARSVNEAARGLAERWRDRSDVTMIHVTGRRYFDLYREPVHGALDYRVMPYGDMTLWWAVADVAVTRAGATTVAELCALGIPSVLVPLPGAPGDHQGVNARRLVSDGAATLLSDAEVSAQTLESALRPLFDESVRNEMASRARALGRLDAAERIAEEIERVAR
ncbi:MAG: glycosyltransferase [Acidobacteria bacterium]|nr:glycosyltransferase [Acidobacteriota bacterium]